ncbi:MAG: mechanosensitive ion channel family protein [Verrucomicrobiae bacterium]|nr:mechanosensitive ion channel family protein [Verrucomicrobiae bacterium]
MPDNTLHQTASALITAQETLVKFFVEYGFKLLGALLILIAGVVLARYIGKFVQERLAKIDIEPPIKLLLVRVARLLVIGFTLLIAVQNLGVNIMPLIAGMGVVGVGIGLAMQGVLSNAMAGLTIIFTKPYRVGDYIAIHDVEGEVVAIELFTTTLAHPDLSRIRVPNRKIVGEILHNFGALRQLDMNVGVAYSTDLDKALTIIREVLAADPVVLKEPQPIIGVNTLADSSIVIAIKPWTSVKAWPVAHARIYQEIVDRFRARGVSIPFPQREVRILHPTAA